MGDGVQHNFRIEVLGQMMVQLAKDKNMQGGGECSLCKLATSWLGQQLANNATEQEILAGLETLCTKLPSQYSAQCTALVSAEGPAILNLLAQELPNLCDALHLCSDDVDGPAVPPVLDLVQ